MRPPAILSSKDDKDKGVVAWATDVVRAIRELQSIPFLDGVRLNNVSIGITDTLIPHKLGRKPQGFWWINPSASASVWQPAAPTASHIHLQSTSAIVTDIWVF